MTQTGRASEPPTDIGKVPRFFVLTGGPGSGKTSIIECLRQDGHSCAPEAGRGIIQDQLSIGGCALPWADRHSFAELMLCWEMRSYREALASDRPVFFDRGVPDVIGYLRLEALEVPDHLVNAANKLRYASPVFIAPPWPKIYRQDDERWQDVDVARRTYESMVQTYVEFGYDLVEIPRASIEERTAFVLERTTSTVEPRSSR